MVLLPQVVVTDGAAEAQVSGVVGVAVVQLQAAMQGPAVLDLEFNIDGAELLTRCQRRFHP